ncbi:arginase family protein [Lentibacillus jeotgali]|uniref:arginase family protein n=1 Tax=Lentibacillus jeotgali TaxID=558169 RepID=UPI00031B3AE6|nr:arginase family protein [Lentibacillus jeotgali]
MVDIYRQTDKEVWSGRVDDEADPATFRFHQMVQALGIGELTGPVKNGFGIIGFASDEGVRRNKGRQGAAHAPDAIRRFLAKLPYLMDGETIDTGNVHCEGEALEMAQAELGRHIKTIFQAGATPIIFSGAV